MWVGVGGRGWVWVDAWVGSPRWAWVGVGGQELAGVGTTPVVAWLSATCQKRRHNAVPRHLKDGVTGIGGDLGWGGMGWGGVG